MEKQKININDFINEVMLQTGIKIDKKDPIIVLLVVNKILLQESYEVHKKILSDYQDDMMELSLKTMTETKDNSTKLINAAVQATKNAFSNAIKESANEFVDTLVSENKEGRKKDFNSLDVAINNLKKLIMMAAGISVINILIAIITLMA